MKISCVIPTHGRPQFLDEALQSVLKQRGVTVSEIVVVDDLGTQDTRTLVERHAVGQQGITIRYLHRTAGQPGASASRNAGVYAAKGDVIAFLDDDDLWAEDHLHSLTRAIEHEEAHLAIAHMWAIEPNGEVREHYSIARGLTPSQVRAQNPGLTGSNFIVRRSAFLEIGGFDSDLPVSNDKDYFIRVIDAGQKYAVSETRSAFHRRHGEGQLTTWDARRLEGTRLLIAKHRGTFSRSDRRYMSAKLHSMARHESRGVVRLWHTLNVAVRTPPGELWLRATGRGRET